MDRIWKLRIALNQDQCMDKRYQVFISSTFEDLQEERRQVMQALLALDCIPTGMELFPRQTTINGRS